MKTPSLRRARLQGFLAAGLLWLSVAGGWAALNSPAPDPHQASDADYNALFDQLAKFKIEPIVVKPGARFSKDVLKDHQAWCERVLLAPFRARAENKPWKDQATAYVTKAVDDLYLHYYRYSEDLEALCAEGRVVVRQGCDDVLVLYLVERLEFREDANWPRIHRELTKLFNRSSPDSSLSPALLTLIGKDIDSGRITAYGKADPAFDHRMLTLLKAALTEGDYGPGDGPIFLHHQFTIPWARLNDRMPGALRPIYDSAPFPEWVKHTMRGEVELAFGWTHDDYISPNAKPAGGKSTTEHLALARKEFVRAWELQPSEPAAASAIIRVITGGGGVPGETERLWFDRATAAQFDYMRAYDDLMWSYKPMWGTRAGGNFVEMFAFGKACAETRRYDTEVPLQLRSVCGEILMDFGDWQHFFKYPAVAQPLLELNQALLKEPTRARQKVRRSSLFAVEAFACGDYALAQRLLASIPKLHPQALGDTRAFGLSEKSLRGLTAVLASAARPLYEKAEKAYARVDLTEARAQYEAASKAAPEGGQALLASRLEIVGIEERLAKGEWVRLETKPALLDWSIEEGNWWAEESGELINLGHELPAFIYHLARVGPELELKARFEVFNNPHSWHRFGLAMGYSWIGSKSWMICELAQQDQHPGSAELTDRGRFWGTHGPKHTVKLRGKNDVLLHASGGKISLEVNGDLVFDRVPPRVVDISAADGRVGLGAEIATMGTRTRITEIQVRRLFPLGSAPEPTPAKPKPVSVQNAAHRELVLGP